jgi:hypothetical protein
MNRQSISPDARPIPGFPDYFVSPSGDVFSTKRGCEIILSPIRATRDGHLHVSLWRDGVGFTMYVHHLVLLAFVGPPSDGEECRHLNGDPADNRLANLCWGTRLENSADRVRHGTTSRGETNGRHKLTEEQVLEIRQLYGSQPQRALAKQYGVSHNMIRYIGSRKSWAHLEGDMSR